jgi:hypothetical protein
MFQKPAPFPLHKKQLAAKFLCFACTQTGSSSVFRPVLERRVTLRNGLRGMERLHFAEKKSLECAIVEIEEVRCDVNADFTEKLADSERFDEGYFWKQRRDFEKKWRDPDDVYIEVQQREEERKKEGLPPRLGVLPHSAVAEQEHQSEVEQARKKAALKKKSK